MLVAEPLIDLAMIYPQQTTGQVKFGISILVTEFVYLSKLITDLSIIRFTWERRR